MLACVGLCAGVSFEAVCRATYNGPESNRRMITRPLFVDLVRTPFIGENWAMNFVFAESCPQEASPVFAKQLNGHFLCGIPGDNGWDDGSGVWRYNRHNTVLRIEEPSSAFARGVVEGFLGCPKLRERFRIKENTNVAESFHDEFYFWVSQNTTLLREYHECTKNTLTRQLAAMADKDERTTPLGNRIPNLKLAENIIEDVGFIFFEQDKRRSMCLYHAEYNAKMPIYYPPFIEDLIGRKDGSLKTIIEKQYNALNLTSHQDTAIYNRALAIHENRIWSSMTEFV